MQRGDMRRRLAERRHRLCCVAVGDVYARALYLSGAVAVTLLTPCAMPCYALRAHRLPHPRLLRRVYRCRPLRDGVRPWRPRGQRGHHPHLPCRVSRNACHSGACRKA